MPAQTCKKPQIEIVEVHPSTDPKQQLKYHWHLRNSNGQIVCRSHRTYTSQNGCVENAQLMVKLVTGTQHGYDAAPIIDPFGNYINQIGKTWKRSGRYQQLLYGTLFSIIKFGDEYLIRHIDDDVIHDTITKLSDAKELAEAMYKRSHES